MLSTFRIRLTASLAVVALVASACGDSESLPTTLDTAATDADIAAVQTVFDAPQVESFANLGYSMDAALASFGGAVLRMPMDMLREGPEQPLATYRPRVASVIEAGTMADVIPVTALGKTFEWNTTTDEYEATARTGAPANGVRFIIYQLDVTGYAPAEPLVEVGYADFTRSSNTGTVAVYNSGGTKLMEYTATVGGTASAPVFSVDGFVGTGANQVTFSLVFGVSLSTGNITVTWRTEMAARGFSSRVSLALGESSITFGALMRSGVRKVEMGGSISATGGTIVVKVGGKVFANIVVNEVDGLTVTNATGGPLTPAEEATLERIFEWFEGAFEAPDALLSPLYTLMDIDLPA